jgi:hypothetical protein
MVIKQEGDFYTTADLDLGTKSNITLIANRDDKGAAVGKIVINEAALVTSPKVDYQFTLSANSI